MRQTAGREFAALPEGKVPDEARHRAMTDVERSEAALGLEVVGVLRGRIFAAASTAGVSELRRVGDRLGERIRTENRESVGEAALETQQQCMVVGLRRLRVHV